MSHWGVAATTPRLARSRRTAARSLAGALATALVIAACGSGGEDGAVDESDAATVPTAVDATPTESPEVDPASLDLEELSAEEAEAEVAADPVPLDTNVLDALVEPTVALVERFGPDGAFDALLLAIARGYDLGAITAGIERGTLDAIGIIDGVEPTRTPSTLLVLPSPAQGFRSAAADEPDEPLPVEELRQRAAAFNRVSEELVEPWEAPEIATGEGVAMLLAVQALADLGLSGDQIINAIVLGFGGIQSRYVQIGMAPATARCRLVIIGGRPEPIGEDRCEGYQEADLRLRDAYLERGFPYPACADRSIEGIYDACAAEADVSDGEGEVAGAERATSGVWTAEGSETSGTGTEFWGTGTIVLADGVYTLTYEITQESNSDCSSFSEIESEASATPNEFDQLFFISVTERFIVSDCPFYEPKGGEDVEVAERTVTAYLLEDDQIRLDLLPGSHFLMEHTPG